MPFIDEQLVANGTTTLGRIIATKAILDIITNDAVLTLAVNAGGTGYVVGETFDVDGGTVIASNPAFNARGVVTAEAAGLEADRRDPLDRTAREGLRLGMGPFPQPGRHHRRGKKLCC